jgi:hypothetical protein
MVIAINDGKTSNLWQYSLIDKSLVQLTHVKSGYYSRPVYSTEGNKILFLCEELEKPKNDLCILDIESNQILKITKGKSYITEAVFTPKGDKIIYCATDFLDDYSPYTYKDSHDLDLYSIMVDGNSGQKLTNLSAYELSSISLNKTGNSLICKLTEKELDGIYLISLSDTSVFQKIEANNNHSSQIGDLLYRNPRFSNDNTSISFMSNYQLYSLDLVTKECELIWDNAKDEVKSMLVFSKFIESDKKIIFSTVKITNRAYPGSIQKVVG